MEPSTLPCWSAVLCFEDSPTFETFMVGDVVPISSSPWTCIKVNELIISKRSVRREINIARGTIYTLCSPAKHERWMQFPTPTQSWHFHQHVDWWWLWYGSMNLCVHFYACGCSEGKFLNSTWPIPQDVTLRGGGWSFTWSRQCTPDWICPCFGTNQSYYSCSCCQPPAILIIATTPQLSLWLRTHYQARYHCSSSSNTTAIIAGTGHSYHHHHFYFYSPTAIYVVILAATCTATTTKCLLLQIVLPLPLCYHHCCHCNHAASCCCQHHDKYNNQHHTIAIIANIVTTAVATTIS